MTRFHAGSSKYSFPRRVDDIQTTTVIHADPDAKRTLRLKPNERQKTSEHAVAFRIFLAKKHSLIREFSSCGT